MIYCYALLCKALSLLKIFFNTFIIALFINEILSIAGNLFQPSGSSRKGEGLTR